MWELIKGTIINETIKNASFKKKHENELEKKLLKEIEALENKLTTTKLDQDEVSQNLYSI